MDAHKAPTGRAVAHIEDRGGRHPGFSAIGRPFKSSTASSLHREPSGVGRGKDWRVGFSYALIINRWQRLGRKGLTAIGCAIEDYLVWIRISAGDPSDLR